MPEAPCDETSPASQQQAAPSKPSWVYGVGRRMIAPVARLVYRPRVEGAEHIPREHAVIFASNHLSVIDSFAIPIAVAPRPVHFLAKSEYFTGSGVSGWLSRMFFTGVGAIPVDRGVGHAALGALERQREILQTGAAVAVHPEGTRSRDGRLYRGRTGVAHLALETGAPIVPIGLIGTDRVLPVGAKLPSFSERVTVRIGEAIDPAPYGANTGRARRQLTEAVMAAIHDLSGQELAGAYNELPSESKFDKLKRALPHERR